MAGETLVRTGVKYPPDKSYLVSQAAVAGWMCQEQPHQVSVALVTGQHEGGRSVMVLQVDICLAAQ